MLRRQLWHVRSWPFPIAWGRRDVCARLVAEDEVGDGEVDDWRNRWMFGVVMVWCIDGVTEMNRLSCLISEYAAA